MKNNGLSKFYGLDDITIEKASNAESLCKKACTGIDETAEYNQCKVVKAFQDNNVSETHFIATTGYGYGDRGREVLDSVYAQIFGSEDAMVRQSMASGTVANTLMIFSNLRPGDEILFASGMPYDTLLDAVGIRDGSPGSMKEYGISHRIVDLDDNGEMNIDAVIKAISSKTKMIFIQRSRGYAWRRPVMVEDIRKAVTEIKKVRRDIIVAVDNCYGEFVEREEPGDAGSDILAGSLIKNPGGGLCASGGYICGRKDLIENCASRLYSPGLSKEVGASVSDKRLLFQGLFMAPHTVAESLKGAVFASALFSAEGYETSPAVDDKRGDIIQLVKFNSKKELTDFCESIQKASPVDSMARPVPWDMPGYEDKVIMAAGTFVQGASIEFSADAPVRKPYIAYMQGGLVYHQVKLGLLIALQSIRNNGII